MISREQYTRRIKANIQAIEGLSAEAYPSLFAFLSRRDKGTVLPTHYSADRTVDRIEP